MAPCAEKMKHFYDTWTTLVWSVYCNTAALPRATCTGDSFASASHSLCQGQPKAPWLRHQRYEHLLVDLPGKAPYPSGKVV